MIASRSTLKTLALALALLLLALSPRALFSRPLHLPRWQGSKRAHLPRYMHPQATHQIVRRSFEVRSRAEFDRLSEEAPVEPGSVQAGASLPDAAAVELAKPRYLRFLEDPHLQTSPPA